VITGELAMVSVTAFDVAPQLTTVTDAVPAVAIKAAGTVAVSCVEETNVVVSAVAFQFTIEVATKFVPFTVNVKPGPPGATQVGSMVVMDGVAVIVKITAFDVPPQGPGVTTVMEAVPGLAMLAFGTLAVS
jgi:hypothetical protein